MKDGRLSFVMGIHISIQNKIYTLMIMPFFKFIGIEERESYGFISNDVHNRLPPSELLLLIANPHTLLLLPNSSSVSIRPSYCNALSVVRLYIFSLNLYSKNLQTHFSSQQFTEPEIKQLCVVSRDIFLRQPNLLELEAPIKICGIISVFSLCICLNFDFT